MPGHKAERGADHACMDDQRHRTMRRGIAPMLDQGGGHARAEVFETLAAGRSMRGEGPTVQNADIWQRVKRHAVMRAEVLLPKACVLLVGFEKRLGGLTAAACRTADDPRDRRQTIFELGDRRAVERSRDIGTAIEASWNGHGGVTDQDKLWPGQCNGFQDGAFQLSFFLEKCFPTLQ